MPSEESYLQDHLIGLAYIGFIFDENWEGTEQIEATVPLASLARGLMLAASGAIIALAEEREESPEELIQALREGTIRA
jgi:hypothetical protein